MVKSDRMSRIMQSFVLLGEIKKQEDYLRTFQKEHSIPDYFVLRYLESFKIADARAIQKTLGAKLRESEERIIVIANPTQDAQNAILKTLEELPERTYIFFLSKTREDVFPTIASRSTFILLEIEGKPVDLDIEKKISEVVLGENNLENLFVLVDLLGVTLGEEQMELVLLSLRRVLIRELSQNPEKSGVLLECLKTLDKNYKLTKTNNINKRMALESSLLGFRGYTH